MREARKPDAQAKGAFEFTRDVKPMPGNGTWGSSACSIESEPVIGYSGRGLAAFEGRGA